MNRIKKYFSDLWVVLKKTFAAWWEADPFRQSSIIAYYAIFSIPSLLVIVIALAGLVFGREAVQGRISDQIGTVIDPQAAKGIEEMIASASKKEASIWATIISVITLIVGATGVFAQLQISLNQIWEVKAQPEKAWLKTIKDRLLSFGLVLSIGFLMLISLLLSTALSAFSDLIKAHLPDFVLAIFELLNFVLSFGVITVLFAFMFKFLPDVKNRWTDVWIGAAATALLFTLGKTALGVYFGKAEPASTYGAAGSVVLLMLWVSYSCMIVFFGAEFTKQNAVHIGHPIIPDKDAVPILSSEEKQTVMDKQEATKKTA
jgi:membrane protein